MPKQVKKDRTYKIFQLSNTIFFKYKLPHRFLYQVEVFRYVKDPDMSYVELVDSGVFETNNFIGLEDTSYSSKNGILYSKEMSLFAAPDEFIKKYNALEVTHDKPKSNTSSSRKSGKGNHNAKDKEISGNK